MSDLEDSLDFVLGLQPMPKEGLSEHYKRLISSLWNKYSQEVFEKLLKEAESPVACDGLMILSEIGVRGKEATDLALTHINHPDWTARFYLADHLLSCVDFLSVSQISKSLPLVGDSRVDVRCKMMELFSRLALSRIIDAVDLNLGQPDFGLHKKGIAILLDKKFSPKCLDVLFSDSEKILITYSGARLLRDWREGLNLNSINLSTDDYEITYLKRRYKSLMAKS